MFRKLPPMPSAPTIGVRYQEIRHEDLERIDLRCWPDLAAVHRLMELQGTIGMAAWEDERCVGVLHAYAIASASALNPDWPQWTRWLPDQWPLTALRASAAELAGPFWCHACHHVGRTQQAATVSDEPDSGYFGRGIGTELVKASAQWARSRGYAAVLAVGMPQQMPQFSVWFGQMPWSRLTKLGFQSVSLENDGRELPVFARNSPPAVQEEFACAIAAGRPVADLCRRLMMLVL